MAHKRTFWTGWHTTLFFFGTSCCLISMQLTYRQVHYKSTHLGCIYLNSCLRIQQPRFLTKEKNVFSAICMSPKYFGAWPAYFDWIKILRSHSSYVVRTPSTFTTRWKTNNNRLIHILSPCSWIYNQVFFVYCLPFIDIIQRKFIKLHLFQWKFENTI